MRLSIYLIKLSLIVITALGIMWFLWIVRQSLYPFVVAFFLAYILNPIVVFVEKKGFSRLHAISLVYVMASIGMIAIIMQLIPVITKELENFARDLPNMMLKVEKLAQELQWHYQTSVLPSSVRTAIDSALLMFYEEIQNFASSIIQRLINMLLDFIWILFSPILAFYILYDWNKIKEEIVDFVPLNWRPRLKLLAKDIDRVLIGVVCGQLYIAIIVAFLLSIVLYVMNIKYALLIGILAGILDFIPYFGALIGAIPAILIAFTESTLLGIKVILLFLIIHQLEGNIIQPKILGNNIGLHPLAVIFFVFVGGELGGVAGMIFGAPIAAIIKIILRHLWAVII